MSKTPKDRSARKPQVSRASQQDDDGDLYDYYDEEEVYAPQPRQSARGRSQPQQPQRSRQRAQQNYRPRSVEPSRTGGNYTILLGVLVALIFVGAILIAYLLGSRSGSGSNNSVSNPPAAIVPTVTSDPIVDENTETYPEVPRIEMADFITMYKDMAKRPILIDVRPRDQFEEEHIKGAISFPSAEMTSRIGELPKDKLVVAYCAWPNEEESAGLAKVMRDEFGFSYDNLKVLRGGLLVWGEENAKDPTTYPIVYGGTPEAVTTP